MNLSSKVEKASTEYIRRLNLPDEFIEVVDEIYLPLAGKLLDRLSDKPLFVSINGAQGTGKTTLTRFLQLIMESELHLPVAAFSMDDFYATHDQRQHLAKTVHPLLATRGVPGTHDLDLLESVIEKLLRGEAVEIPQFDKASDDRYAKHRWPAYDHPVKAILFEGWCNHSPVQSPGELEQPVNELEAREDPRGIWRNHVNEQLAEYHRRIFSRADTCIMLKSPDFEHVLEWRSLQEKKLSDTTPQHPSHRIMNPQALKRFVQHYERITRHTLAKLPETADILLPVNPDHRIAGIIDRHAKQ